MLILRRKAGETLLIGDEVKITVMDIYEGGVRLAIDAPKRISILRSELLQAADANRDAAGGAAGPQALVKLFGSRGAEKQKEQKSAEAEKPEPERKAEPEPDRPEDHPEQKEGAEQPETPAKEIPAS